LICPSSPILKTPDITTKKNLDTYFATALLAKKAMWWFCHSQGVSRDCIHSAQVFTHATFARWNTWFRWYDTWSFSTSLNDETFFENNFLPAASTISWKVITIGWFLCCFTIYVMGGKYGSLRPFSNMKILDDNNASWQFKS